MAQRRVSGTLNEFQNLTANIVYLKIDSNVAGASGNINDFVTVNGNGEKVMRSVATVANPVIVEGNSSNARILYTAVELGGVNASHVETAVQSVIPTAIVTSGSFVVS